VFAKKADIGEETADHWAARWLPYGRHRRRDGSVRVRRDGSVRVRRDGSVRGEMISYSAQLIHRDTSGLIGFLVRLR
jgi:hypothetical protein